MEEKNGVGEYNGVVLMRTRTLSLFCECILFIALALSFLPVGVRGLGAAVFPVFVMVLVLCCLTAGGFGWLIRRILGQEMGTDWKVLNKFVRISEVLMVIFGCAASCAGILLGYVDRVLEFVHPGLTWKSSTDELVGVLYSVLGMTDEWGELTWLMEDSGRTIQHLWLLGSVLHTVWLAGVGFLGVSLLAVTGVRICVPYMNRRVNVTKLSFDIYRLYAVYFVLMVAAVAGGILISL